MQIKHTRIIHEEAMGLIHTFGLAKTRNTWLLVPLVVKLAT